MVLLGGMLVGWLVLVGSSRRCGYEMHMLFTTTRSSSVEVWFGEEERFKLEGEAEAFYVPPLLSISLMKFSFPSKCSIVMANSLITCYYLIFVCLSWHIVMNITKALWSVSTITL